MDEDKKEPEIDLSELDEEDRKEVGFKFPKGLLIFIVCLITIIIALSITLSFILKK